MGTVLAGLRQGTGEGHAAGGSPEAVAEVGRGVEDGLMGMEELSRAREQELHGLRLDLKRQIASAPPGTPRHAALVRQLGALDRDNDDAQDRWFQDFVREYPLGAGNPESV